MPRFFSSVSPSLETRIIITSSNVTWLELQQRTYAVPCCCLLPQSPPQQPLLLLLLLASLLLPLLLGAPAAAKSLLVSLPLG
jgi:hypothetical protein